MKKLKVTIIFETICDLDDFPNERNIDGILKHIHHDPFVHIQDNCTTWTTKGEILFKELEVTPKDY